MSVPQKNKYFLFRNSEALSNVGADAHYHSYFEIYSLTSGGGDSFIGNKLYNLRPGDVVMIPPGAIHGTHYSTEKHGRILLNFTVHYVPESLRELILKDHYFYRCDETGEEVSRIFREIEKENNTPDRFSECAISALLSKLIIMIVRYAQQEEVAIPADGFIESVIDYVQKNYRNPLPLDEIAQECNVSKVHLSRKFKDKTGIGLNRYILICRMKKAKELLLLRDRMSICEIAYECGFNDSNYFSWLFRKTFGVTPLQYRKNTRE